MVETRCNASIIRFPLPPWADERGNPPPSRSFVTRPASDSGPRDSKLLSWDSQSYVIRTGVISLPPPTCRTVRREGRHLLREVICLHVIYLWRCACPNRLETRLSTLNFIRSLMEGGGGVCPHASRGLMTVVTYRLNLRLQKLSGTQWEFFFPF